VLIVVFIFLGLIAGYGALGLFKSTGKGFVFDCGLGVIGAVVVGSLLEHIAATGTAGLNAATALAAALAGAAALLATFHGLRDMRYRRGDLTGSSNSKFRIQNEPGLKVMRDQSPDVQGHGSVERRRELA